VCARAGSSFKTQAKTPRYDLKRGGGGGGEGKKGGTKCHPEITFGSFENIKNMRLGGKAKGGGDGRGEATKNNLLRRRKKLWEKPEGKVTQITTHKN